MREMMIPLAADDDAPEIECPFTEALVRALIPWSHSGTVVSRGEADPADLARRLVTLYPLSVAVCAYRRDVLSRACRGVDYAVRVIARAQIARFSGWPVGQAVELLSTPITPASAPWIGLAAWALRESWTGRSDRSAGATAVLYDVCLTLHWLCEGLMGTPRALEVAGRSSAWLAISEGCMVGRGTWEPAERLARVALGVELAASGSA